MSKLYSTLAITLGALALPALGAGAALAASPPSASERGSATAPAPAPRDVLVRFRGGATASDRAGARRRARTRFEESLPLRGLQRVDPEPGVSVRSAVAALERSPAVAYAEPDAIRSARLTPDDKYFNLLWGLHNTGQTILTRAGTADADIDGPEAWDLTTGSAGVTVGVVDTGVDGAHPDLSPNMWRNPGETGSGRETNAVDDDANGLVDDWRGWDWVDSDNAPDDLHGHGTHVSGTVGARGNDGTGVAGVAWNAGILPLRVLDANGYGTVSSVISGYSYASAKGAQVVNASLGASTYSQAERDAIAAAPDTLFVVAAGNDGADNDSTGSYPCNYDLANVVCVAASDQDDGLASFSNYGSKTVDLAAPGESIASTWPGGQWAYLDGTSMATPHVAGAAALAWSHLASPSVSAVRTALLSGVDAKASLSGRTVTGGRLNAYGALTEPATSSSDSTTSSSGGGTTSSSDSQTSSGSGTGGSTSGTASPPASDATAPTVTIRVAARHRLLTALRRRLAARLKCSERCALRVQLLVLSRKRAARLGLGRRRSVVVASGRSRMGAAGWRRVRASFTARAKRRLRQVRSVRLALRVRAVDPSGNVRTRTVRVRLVR